MDSQFLSIWRKVKGIPGKNTRKEGLSIWTGALFLLATMAGRGILALPSAFLGTGLIGILLLTFLCVNSLYSVQCLGACWSILEERYEEYRIKKSRRPYASIAYRASGKIMQHFVSFCLIINLLGVAIVYLLLSSEITESVVDGKALSYCNWIMVFAVIFCPMLWLGTPDDFWVAGVMSFISTLVVSVGIIIMILLDDTDITEVKYTPISVDSFFLGFGAMFFALGGAASFPTVQNDMKDRKEFPKSAFLAFALVLFLYLPLSILGCLVYGDQLTENVLDSVPSSIFKTSIEVLSVFHMIFSLPLVISPCSLELEELLNVPQEFGWKRVALRSSIMAFILFVGLTVPDFGKVIHFIGGSVIVLTTTVFPCLFYLQLTSQKNPAWRKKYYIPFYERSYLIIIIVSGVAGGATCTYAAVKNIVALKSLVPPCYINATASTFYRDIMLTAFMKNNN